MANADSTLKTDTTPTTSSAVLEEGSQHYYTIGYRPNQGKPNPLPQLTLKGRWLERAGFKQGTPIVVTVTEGKMVINLLEKEK